MRGTGEAPNKRKKSRGGNDFGEGKERKKGEREERRERRC